MEAILLILALASAPPSYGDFTSTVEVNHVVAPDGHNRFTQLIYREGNWLIRDWRYLSSQDMLPDSRMHLAVWRENGAWRMLWCETTVETWTWHDPEREEVNWRPATDRKGLFKTRTEAE